MEVQRKVFVVNFTWFLEVLWLWLTDVREVSVPSALIVWKFKSREEGK